MTKTLRVQDRSYLDNESRAMIYHGASANQLAELFRIRVPDVMRRLAGINPIGTGRQGNPLYRVADAAPRLMQIPITEEMIIDYLRKLNPKDLPPLLNKAFWEAMKVRARYREEAGELWLTTDVLQVASEAFQSLRMSLLLIPDRLRDETGISEAQVRLCERVIDTALDDARNRLIDDLRKPGGHRSEPDAEDGAL
jgi:hypothetical protein